MNVFYELFCEGPSELLIYALMTVVWRYNPFTLANGCNPTTSSHRFFSMLPVTIFTAMMNNNSLAAV